MITTKGIKVLYILKWSWHHILWVFVLMLSISLLYHYELITLSLPWVPVSVIGTSVAFYVGFKNNQAYDRMWEARKIWGGIVNESRTWGMMVDSFITNLFTTDKKAGAEIHRIKQRLIYRHVAWLYSHRNQLLAPTPWEHASQSGALSKLASHYQMHFGLGLFVNEATGNEIKQHLPEVEYNDIVTKVNPSTHIINEQSRDLAQLREKDVIDDFRHMELEKVLQAFYNLQGKNERIKKFPLPRQYANMSRYFVGIFIILFPFSMIPQLININTWGLFLSVSISAIVGWIYLMMELIGDYSENPFQGMANDIPMMSLCRTIEIDLKEILKERELPRSVTPKNGVLM
ncbi:bestrophin family protein [Roseivirga pacifica]|uniref:bestrophin family protein n=1 Tax=Roseivirga pacifica TaxID=1267423 RepID=UPI003BAFC5A9